MRKITSKLIKKLSNIVYCFNTVILACGFHFLHIEKIKIKIKHLSLFKVSKMIMTFQSQQNDYFNYDMLKVNKMIATCSKSEK